VLSDIEATQRFCYATGPHQWIPNTYAQNCSDFVDHTIMCCRSGRPRTPKYPRPHISAESTAISCQSSLAGCQTPPTVVSSLSNLAARQDEAWVQNNK